MRQKSVEQIVALTRRQGLLRPRDLAQRDIPRAYLRLALEQGLVERVGRGLYQLPGTAPTEHFSIAEVCKRVPAAVVCLLSALRFHDLTTQNPFDVWIAIGEKAHLPRVDTVRIRVARFSGPALSEGIDTHTLCGVPVRVYNPAKTVADCFKYRHKIGTDVAIEALRDCLKARKASVDELVRMARVCRVERVMSPYLEALL